MQFQSRFFDPAKFYVLTLINTI